MFDIKMTYNGKPFDKNEFIRDLTREVHQNVEAQLRERIGAFVCPVHGKSPEVLEIRIEGDKAIAKYDCCCKEFEETVQKSFS